MKDLFRPTDTKDRRRGSSVRIAGLSGVDEQCGDPPMLFPRLLLAQDRGFPWTRTLDRQKIQRREKFVVYFSSRHG